VFQVQGQIQSRKSRQVERCLEVSGVWDPSVHRRFESDIFLAQETEMSAKEDKTS